MQINQTKRLPGVRVDALVRRTGGVMEEGFEKLPQIAKEELHRGCLNCSTACLEAPMDMVVAVGFGSAFATKDGEVVYDELECDGNWDNFKTVVDIEAMAIEDPDHDWRIEKHGPLHGETFQRHGPGKWVCIESNQGFA